MCELCSGRHLTSQCIIGQRHIHDCLTAPVPAHYEPSIFGDEAAASLRLLAREMTRVDVEDDRCNMTRYRGSFIHKLRSGGFSIERVA
jgi:hypothetical protein